ncbi:MAG: triose-phosphate isomerase [Candidatus Eremiobacteraeota bacterium]|nr:triose-phosphate isomerase [Candidatus Eremiobacteraeota bacterium]
MRRTLVAGNWKMHKTVREAVALAHALAQRSTEFPAAVDVAVCPPFTALEAVGHRLRECPRIALGAQNMHWENHGPFTGEISPVMLADLEVRYVIVGHSERRMYCGEMDEACAKKVRAALAHGIVPILAVGETLAEKETGLTLDVVRRQTRAGFSAVTAAELAHVVLAYEPVWAIGTGRSDDPTNANATMQAIRESLAGLSDVPILYGGSVKPENMEAFAAMPNVDGALVGGASLDADSFTEIVRGARVVAR